MLTFLRNAWIRFALAVGIGAVFAVLAFQYHWFAGLDLKVYDLGLSIRPGLGREPDVVIVSLDRYSRANALPPPEFPVSAHVEQHAVAVRRLSEAGARVMAMDILFDQIDPGLDVTRFRAALEEAGTVCLAAAIERVTLAVRAEGTAIVEERLVIPASSIPADHYCMGLVNMPVDQDLAVRRSSYGQTFQKEFIPSMPAALAAAFSGGAPPEAGHEATFFIDYRIMQGGLPVVSYFDVIEGEGWQETVRDRIVLIGVTENSLSDVYQMPVRGLPGTEHGNKLPGVLILAYATQTLVSGSLVTHLPDGGGLPLAIGLAAVVALVASGRRLALSAGLILVVLFGVLICGVLAVALRLTILPSALMLVVALMTAAAGLTVNYLHARFRSEVQERELEEISSDLRKAAAIQKRLQPESMPAVEGLDIAGLQIPCKEIGGDYYDVIDLGQGRIGLMIADVCGKGISAALLMSNLQSNFRQLAPVAGSPRKLVVDLNSIACQVFSEGRFVTLLYAILDVPNRRLTYSSAGHMPPLLCRSDGKVIQLEPGGIPIGPFPDFDWDEHEVDLHSGDLIFMYTDGLSEATDRKTEEMFDERRIEAYLRSNCGKMPDELNRGIVGEARAFSKSEALDDDITLLSVRLG